MADLGTNYVFAFNNWLFGGPGQGVQILSIDGLEDLPGLRVQDDNRGYNDGMFTGRDFLDGRYITMQLQVMGDANHSMTYYLTDPIVGLKTHLVSQQSGLGTLQFTLPGRDTQLVNARVRRRSITIDPSYVYGRAVVTVQFFCPDPRIYSNTSSTARLSFAGTTARVYPRTFPTTYSVAGAGLPRFGSLANNGNTTTFPVISFYGPCVNPSIVNATSGKILKLNATLGSNEIATIDTDFHTVLINGVNARNLLTNTSRWFGMEPGVTSLGYSADTAGSDSTATITWRNAYI
jgi:hypothetical protein